MAESLDLLATGAGLDVAQPIEGLDLLADPNAPGPFRKGLGAGLAGVKSSLGGAGALVARAIGATGLEKTALDYAAEQGDIASQSAQPIEQVDWSSPKSIADQFKFLLGQAVPSLATMFVGGVAGRGLGALAGRTMAAPAAAAATRAGTYAGAIAPDVAMEAGSIYPEALKTGVENPALRAAAGGAAAASLDFLPLLAAERYLKAAGRGGFGAMARGAAKGAPVGAALEGTQEALQTGIERVAAGQNLTDEQAISDYINSFAGGAAPGVVLGGAVGAARSRAPVVQKPPVSTERELPIIPEQPPIVGAQDVGTSAQVPTLTPDVQHTLATQAMADSAAAIEQARAAHEAAAGRLKELDAEAKLPNIADRRTLSEIVVERKGLIAARKATKGKITELETQYDAARKAAAALEPQIAAMNMPDLGTVEPDLGTVAEAPVAPVVPPVPKTEAEHVQEATRGAAAFIAQQGLSTAKEGRGAGVTTEADALIETVDAGGVPGFMTSNLKRIMAENDIPVTGQMTPNDAIAALRAKTKVVTPVQVREKMPKPSGQKPAIVNPPPAAKVVNTVGAVRDQMKAREPALRELITSKLKGSPGGKATIAEATLRRLTLIAQNAHAQATPEAQVAYIKSEVVKQGLDKRFPAKELDSVVQDIHGAVVGAATRFSKGASVPVDSRSVVAALLTDFGGNKQNAAAYAEMKAKSTTSEEMKAKYVHAASVLRGETQQSVAALTSDQFETLPQAAKESAVDYYDKVMTERGTQLIARVRDIVGNDPHLTVTTFTAAPGSPIGGYTRTGPLKSLISLALNAKNEMSVADHEAFHYAEDRVLDGRERQIITNASKNDRPLFKQLLEKVQQYDRENNTHLADEITSIPAERRAYAFEFWKRGELRADTALARVFEKIRQFFERIANAVTGLGFQSIEDIFTALDRGQYSERQRNNAEGLSGRDSRAARAEQTESPQFKAWFRDSKVVDAAGKPLVVYHGTDQDFDSFGTKESLALFKNLGIPDGTFFFTGSPETAATYAQSDDGTTGGNIMPVYISMQNPHRVDAKGATWIKVMQRAIGEAADAKNDGVIVRNVVDDIEGKGEPSDVYVVFKRGQIKSAIGNRGTFDPSDPSILHSKAAVDMDRQMKSGELQQTQANEAGARLMEATAGTSATWRSTVEGLGLETSGGFSRWWQKYISTPNFIAHYSDAFKNVFRVLNTYNRYSSVLIKQMLKEQMPEWYTASKADQDAVFAALTKRNVGKFVKGSAEYQDLLSPLTPQQATMFASATRMVEGFLLKELEVDKVFYKKAYSDPKDYDTWLAGRQTQVEDLIAHGYEPLERFGDHTVTMLMPFTDAKGRVQNLAAVHQQFESQADAYKMAEIYKAELARQGSTLSVETGIRHKTSRDATISVQQFLDTARRNGVALSQTETERIVKALTAADSMVRNRLMRRKEVPGYSTDGMRVLNSFGVKMAGKIAYAKFASAIDAALAGRAVDSDLVRGANGTMEPEIIIDELRGEPGATETADEFEGRNLWKIEGAKGGFARNLADEISDYVLVPDHTGMWSRKLRAAAMMYFIGGSISGAVVNVMSIPMLLVPELSIHTDYQTAAAASLSAWKLTWQHQAILRDIVRLKDKDNNPLPGIDEIAGLREALITASEDGRTMDTEIHQITGMAQGAMFSQSRTVQKAMEVWMSPFRLSEQTNRITAFIAAYKVAATGKGVRQTDGSFLTIGGQELYRFAGEMVDSTQNNYNAANRPGAARHPIYAMLFMFKSFPLFMTEAIVLMHKANPKSAVYMLLGLTMMTGVQGLPFAETLENLIDVLAQRVFGSPFNTRRAMRNVIKSASEAMVGYDASELVMRGMVNEIFGISMSSRIGAGDFVPGTRLGAAESEQGRILQDLLGAPYAMVKDAAAQAGKFTGGVFTGDWKQTMDALRTGGPVALRNVIKGSEQLVDGYASDARGRKVVDVTGMEALLQLTGLAPAAVAKMYEYESINIQTKAFYTQVSRDMQDQLVQALKDNDATKVQEINDLRNAWNQSYPTMQILPNAAAARRAIILAGMPLDRRSQMLWGRRIRGNNIFVEPSGEETQ